MNATANEIEKNEEIKILKHMLGLEEFMDYSIPENRKRLRYGGGIIIFADADVNGKHIVGLLLNYFYCRFPSLLKIGYVILYLTPILRLTRGKRVLKFFSEADYEEWKEQDDDTSGWNSKYFKGLATSTNDDIYDDYQDKRILACVYDDKAEDAIKLAFDEKQSDARKEWVENWQPMHGNR